MSEETLLRRLRAECICGCGQPARPDSQYASAACRARRYDQKNPRVNKAPPEALRRRLIETYVPPNTFEGYDPENQVWETTTISREEAERRWPSKPRRPRPPRIHIDVLGEDVRLLKLLAAEVGRTPTDYIRELIRLAGTEAELSGVRGALIGPKEDEDP